MKNWKVHKKQSTKAVKNVKTVTPKKRRCGMYMALIVALIAGLVAILMGSSKRVCCAIHSIPFVRSIWQHKYCLVMKKTMVCALTHVHALFNYVKNMFCCFISAITSRVPILASVERKIKCVWGCASKWVHKNICVHIKKAISCLVHMIDRVLERFQG